MLFSEVLAATARNARESSWTPETEGASTAWSPEGFELVHVSKVRAKLMLTMPGLGRETF